MSVSKSKAALLAGLFLVLLCAFAAHGQDVPRISKDDLKATLGKPNLITLDVRTHQQWRSSQWKIQGAVREEPDEVGAWINKYPKDKTLVLYCS